MAIQGNNLRYTIFNSIVICFLSSFISEADQQVLIMCDLKVETIDPNAHALNDFPDSTNINIEQPSPHMADFLPPSRLENIPLAPSPLQSRYQFLSTNGNMFSNGKEYATSVPQNEPILNSFEPRYGFEPSMVDSFARNSLDGDSDMIQASLASMDRAETEHPHLCKNDEVHCLQTAQCIRREHWCDKIEHCADLSDEMDCSCIQSLSAERNCDNYPDCPFQSDEMGCFDCSQFSYSCYENIQEFLDNQSRSACFSQTQRCDGVMDCFSGKDEQNCEILVKNLTTLARFSKPNSQGYPHRNFKGVWYPMCMNDARMIENVCKTQIGETIRISDNPLKSEKDLKLFINNVTDEFGNMKWIVQDSCPDTDNTLPYMNCGSPKCGTVLSQSPMRLSSREDQNEHIVGIAGGTDAEPGAFPFVVALIKNGHQNCGGAIFGDEWVITAKHCVEFPQNHFYQIRAGMLRRRSSSPFTQTINVVRIHSYSDDSFDVALLKLETSLSYNRWVSPICLPDERRVTSDEGRDWKMGPKQGTMCSVIGWGRRSENGSVCMSAAPNKFN